MAERGRPKSSGKSHQGRAAGRHQRPSPGRRRRAAWIGAAAVLLLAAGVAWWARPGGKGGVESFPSEGSTHVPQGTRISYRTDPPTSGPHYDVPADPGFYDVPPLAGNLVHSLEHGIVVIYYDPDRLESAALAHVRELTERYQDRWAGVIAVPRVDEKYPLILTAWRHRLRLQAYDAAAVDAFVDRFRGRGPENPVR